jgi:hypothetical protein
MRKSFQKGLAQPTSNSASRVDDGSRAGSGGVRRVGRRTGETHDAAEFSRSVFAGFNAVKARCLLSRRVSQ